MGPSWRRAFCREWSMKEQIVMRLLGKIATVAAFAVILAILFTTLPAKTQDGAIRVGFQRYGNLILLKGKGGLEKNLAPLGFKVEWKEFP